MKGCLLTLNAFLSHSIQCCMIPFTLTASFSYSLSSGCYSTLILNAGGCQRACMSLESHSLLCYSLLEKKISFNKDIIFFRMYSNIISWFLTSYSTSWNRGDVSRSWIKKYSFELWNRVTGDACSGFSFISWKDLLISMTKAWPWLLPWGCIQDIHLHMNMDSILLKKKRMKEREIPSIVPVGSQKR